MPQAWKRTFALHTADKELVLRIFRENIQRTPTAPKKRNIPIEWKRKSKVPIYEKMLNLIINMGTQIKTKLKFISYPFE